MAPTNKICTFGGVEIENAPGETGEGGRLKRRETGRCCVAQIPNRGKPTVEREITKRVAQGSLILTDSHKSYDWLPRGGLYLREKVNRSIRGWAGRRGRTTNTIGGMWSRVKRSLRMANTHRPTDNGYAPLFREFMWRMRFVRGRN